MILDWVLWGLWAVAIASCLALAFLMSRLQTEIDKAVERNKKLLQEISETWERSSKLNDETMRALGEIKRLKGEDWKGN